MLPASVNSVTFATVLGPRKGPAAEPLERHTVQFVSIVSIALMLVNGDDFQSRYLHCQPMAQQYFLIIRLPLRAQFNTRDFSVCHSRLSIAFSIAFSFKRENGDLHCFPFPAVLSIVSSIASFIASSIASSIARLIGKVALFFTCRNYAHLCALSQPLRALEQNTSSRLHTNHALSAIVNKFKRISLFEAFWLNSHLVA